MDLSFAMILLSSVFRLLSSVFCFLTSVLKKTLPLCAYPEDIYDLLFAMNNELSTIYDMLFTIP